MTEPIWPAMVTTALPLAARRGLCLADLAGRRLPGGSEASHGQPAATRYPTDSRTCPVSTSPAWRAADSLEPGRDLQPRRDGQRRVLHACLGGPALPAIRIAYRSVSDLPDSALAVAWPQDARSSAVAACTIAAAAHARAESAMQSAATKRQGDHASPPPDPVQVRGAEDGEGVRAEIWISLVGHARCAADVSASLRSRIGRETACS